jgi:hypothetical protein
VNQPSEKPAHLRRLLICIGLLLAMWVPALGFDYYVVRPLAGIFVPTVMATGLVLIVRWRSLFPTLLIAASPLTVIFAMGIADWFSTRPQFVGMGLPSMTASNLDPDTRCYHSTGGCVVGGGEWIFLSPRNAGLKLMCTVFGRPRHTYRGPYPNPEDALALVTNATRTATKDFLDGRVTAKGREIILKRKTVDGILFDLGNIYAGADIDGVTTEVQANIYQERCLIVRVRTEDRNSPEIGTSDGIYLFDADTVRPFARFILAGRAGRIPRLLTELSEGD